MKKHTAIFAILSGLMFFNFLSCQKEEIVQSNTEINSESNFEVETKSQTRDRRFHWRCPECGFQNGGWTSECSVCGEDYSQDMADLVISLWLQEETLISTITVPANWGGGEPRPGSIQLSGYVFTAIPPTEWYETQVAMNYYNQYMGNILLTDEYKEAFNYAWYKVTHILYPGVHMSVRVESLYDRWFLNYARYLTGQKGQGLKDGSRAAVQAFANRM